jgi:hypothetical protein
MHMNQSRRQTRCLLIVSGFVTDRYNADLGYTALETLTYSRDKNLSLSDTYLALKSEKWFP